MSGQGQDQLPTPRNTFKIVRIILPPILAMALFFGALFYVFLPALESSALDKKREMIQALTRTAWNTLDMYQRMARTGELTQEQAQVSAIRHLRAQRYGIDSKAYFWILNMQARLIMHPNLPQLEGQSLESETHAEIEQTLKEMVTMVRNKGEGYAEHIWQWKDDPQSAGKKVSYLKEFGPWQWIVGTGVYLDDVAIDVEATRGKLIKVSLTIIGIICVLLIFIIRGELINDAVRTQAARQIKAREKNLRSLIKAVPDPMIVYDIDGRVTYLNMAFTRVFGWELSEVKGRRIDFIPEKCKSATDGMIQKTIKFGFCANFETQRLKKSGDAIDVSLSTTYYRDEAGKPLGMISILNEISEISRTRKDS